jgi:hypothetical protein
VKVPIISPFLETWILGASIKRTKEKAQGVAMTD